MPAVSKKQSHYCYKLRLLDTFQIISQKKPGFGKKTPNAAKFKQYTGLEGDVSPDAEVDINQFENNRY